MSHSRDTKSENNGILYQQIKMDCPFDEEAILDGQVQTVLSKLGPGSGYHHGLTCDPLRLYREQESPFMCRAQSTGCDRIHVPPIFGPQASPMNVEPQLDCRNEDEKHIYLACGQDKTTRDDLKGVDDVTTRASTAKRNEYHLDTSRQHFDQSNITAFKPSDYLSQNQHPQSRLHHGQSSYQSQTSRHMTQTNNIKHTSQLRCHQLTANLARSIFIIVALNTISNYLNHVIHLEPPAGALMHLRLFAYPTIVAAEPITECSSHEDCQNPDKICYESKCICGRIRPIEDKERSECLPHASPNEACTLTEQCIGNSICIESICSCPSTDIEIFNPSTKLPYCHPKRGLHEDCNFDAQCPDNAFCSTKKQGCLCENGYGESLVRGADGIESRKCLAKACTAKEQCESNFHICDENKCKCLAAHFDPHTGGCYEFISTGGDVIGRIDGNTTRLDDDRPTSIIDLMKNGDKLWLVVIILGILTLIFLVILIMLLRRNYLGYCWTHTKEYEPNNKSSTKNGQFNKNSINNKSFRRKNGDLDEDEEAGSGADDTAADHSSLVTASSKKDGALLSDLAYTKRNGSDNVNENHYVQVDMRAVSNAGEADDNQHLPSTQYQRPHQQVLARPLPSSTSTPV